MHQHKMFSSTLNSEVSLPNKVKYLIFPDTRGIILFRSVAKDCESSLNSIIKKIDHLVATNNGYTINRLKTFFGPEAVVDIRDFAQTIAFPREYPSVSYAHY